MNQPGDVILLVWFWLIVLIAGAFALVCVTEFGRAVGVARALARLRIRLEAWWYARKLVREVRELARMGVRSDHYPEHEER